MTCSKDKKRCTHTQKKVLKHTASKKKKKKSQWCANRTSMQWLQTKVKVSKTWTQWHNTWKNSKFVKPRLVFSFLCSALTSRCANSLQGTAACLYRVQLEKAKRHSEAPWRRTVYTNVYRCKVDSYQNFHIYTQSRAFWETWYRHPGKQKCPGCSECNNLTWKLHFLVGSSDILVLAPWYEPHLGLMKCVCKGITQKW